MSHVKGLLQVNAWQTTHIQLSLLVHDFSVKLSLYPCSHSSLAALLSACGTCTSMCKCNRYSLRLPPGWCSVKNALGTCKEACRGGKSEEWEKGKGRNFECVFWEMEEERTGEEMNVWRGQKL